MKKERKDKSCSEALFCEIELNVYGQRTVYRAWLFLGKMRKNLDWGEGSAEAFL